MKWTKPEGYAKNKIDKAGEIISGRKYSDLEMVNALEILDNWRAIHAYPVHIFKKRLKRSSLIVDTNAISAQRLKRVPSIINKLRRSYDGNKPTMNLTQMQDIGGCRAVLSNVQKAYDLYDKYYIKGDLKHEMVNNKDYIKNPKEDGYRSFHIIYRYNSDKDGKKDFNRLLIEVQIRSKLQHFWATAIETVDFFTRQAIKTNEGDAEWKDFFRLVSSAFAIIEKCPLVPNTPTDEIELYKKIKEKEKQLNVVKVMGSWNEAIKVFEEASKTQPDLRFFLLELDISRERLNITAYTDKEEQKAIDDYELAEKNNKGEKEFDVVLVGADTMNDLKKAYPNYFVDTREFINYLKKVIKKAD